jgi:AcrR family transcriptional regulator
MPRKADPQLEQAIVTAALRLLDKRGLEAVTIRDVAKVAGTTTPTLYERFKDRDALLIAVLDRIATEMREQMEKTRTVEAIGEVFLDYCARFPNRFEFLHRVWPPTLPTNRRRPTYELAVSRLQSQYGHSLKASQDIASSMMAILLGTSIFMIGSGTKTQFAARSRRIGLRAFKAVCKGI